MSRLIARFDVNLQGGNFLFKRPMIDDLCYKTTIRDFDVELCLYANIPACFRNIHKMGESVPGEYIDENYYWAISKVRIHSASNEDATVPMPQTIGGRTSYEERCRYFDIRQTTRYYYKDGFCSKPLRMRAGFTKAFCINRCRLIDGRQLSKIHSIVCRSRMAR